VYAPYVEHVPPDVTAQIFWLKNRDPPHWRGGWQIDHNLGKYVISDKPMTEEEWTRQRANKNSSTIRRDVMRRRVHRQSFGWLCRRGVRLRAGYLDGGEDPGGGGSSCWRSVRRAVYGQEQFNNTPRCHAAASTSTIFWMALSARWYAASSWLFGRW
jgi:hypothetical protein